MGKYVLLTETGGDVTADMKKQYGIWTVPMHVTFDDVTKDDGTFPTTDVFEFHRKTGKLPKTSGCAPADFEKVFDEIHRLYPKQHILHLAYSAVTTCSFDSALTAAKGRDYVTSIDTKFVSAGQALVTLYTARYLEAHPDCALSEIKEQVLKYCDRCRMGFFPGDLEYLKAGGRVSNAAYLGARLLSLTPLIELKDGKLVGTKKYRGSMRKVAPRLLSDYVKQYHLSREILVFVYSAGLDLDLRHSLEEQAKEMGFKEILWVETGCVVSTHSGPGAFGVCGFEAHS